MMRAIFRSTSGASAVEFALVAPVLMTLMFSGLVMAMAIWTGNAVQDAAQEAARCTAIGSSNCATVSSGCDSASAAICYAETVAVNRGLMSISASNITINTNTSSGGVTFTNVTIAYPFSMVGFSFTVVGYGSFPNST